MDILWTYFNDSLNLSWKGNKNKKQKYKQITEEKVFPSLWLAADIFTCPWNIHLKHEEEALYG